MIWKNTIRKHTKKKVQIRSQKKSQKLSTPTLPRFKAGGRQPRLTLKHVTGFSLEFDASLRGGSLTIENAVDGAV